ncbi:predicted protein [Arabidopsis lyrata subsp. lyrata]|uniref:Predicted protein n=1 Tax=Arabidopsis lyrata subsp. lyrata TaxID=81972 RepID=D7L4V0_ARALL|nr:predicted protein [Arabidopsis lyrata subsp. lyrata]
MTISSKTQFPLFLPAIDFSSQDLKPETLEWDSMRARVRKTLEKYGCFEALFDGASVELRKAVFEASEEVFHLPLETKISTKSDKLYKGYAGQKILRFVKILYISKNVQSFAEQLIKLDVKHFLTILCQNDVVDGLEIKTKDGEEWTKAKPTQDSSFLVIAGASLHVLLNGGVFPPLHRVVITGKKDRHAAGLFLLPKEGLIINAHEEVVDDVHPRLYKPFDFEAYFKFTYTDTKKRDLSALKTYCSL